MDSNILQNIRTHKLGAANAREFGELQLALREALAAIHTCETYLAQLRTATSPDTDKIRRTARELADSYGVAGGIFRRMGAYEQALEMYNKGADLERDAELRIENTYNLTNALVTTIIADPHTFGQNRKAVEDVRQRVEKQLQETRRQDWWAWADLGTLALLEGNAKMAVSAYLRFRDQGATSANCEKAATVVREIGKALNTFAPDVARSSQEILHVLAPRPA